MSLKSAEGKQLWKALEIKLFMPQIDLPKVIKIKSDPGTGMSREMIADYLAATGLELKEAFPTHQYKLIERAPNAFTFVPTGVRIAPESTPESATVS